jgi:hypothetical protein
MNAPDEKWLPFIKLAFLFIIILALTGLAFACALGSVKEANSYSLKEILSVFYFLAGVLIGRVDRK